MKEIRAHIRNGTHQQSAGAATFDHQLFLGAVPFADQVLGAGYEVGKGIFLAHHAAVIVPCLPHLSAATRMGYGVNDSTIDQTENVRVEVDVD